MEESERIEEYLEIIYRLEEKGVKATTVTLSEALKISPSTVTEMLQKLAEKGYLEYVSYKGVTLTEKGREIGRKILERHRLVEEFLKFINVDERKIHDLACKIEHVMDDDVFNGISNLLYKYRQNGNLKLLSELSEGENATVVTINGESKLVKRLMDMGFVIKAPIIVKRSLGKRGPMIVSIKGSEIAIGKEIADSILVRE
ncbi:MAG: metal-dependent transcriptional regulator [Thermoplasmata archaeon]|nr:metal-dependent transcriptional regulator [Staphylococcus epidermidis]